MATFQPTWDEVQTWLQDESGTVEWKKTGDPDDIVQTLVAFANTNGGHVLCGVEEWEDDQGRRRPKATGLEADKVKSLRNKIHTPIQRIKPPITYYVATINLPDSPRQLLIFRATKSKVVVYFQHHKNDQPQVWVRRDDQNRPETDVKALMRHTGELGPWLDELAEDAEGHWATEADIEVDNLAALVKQGGLPQSAEFYLRGEGPVEGTVPALSVKREGAYVPRRFAMLLFGKHPEQWIRGAYILAVEFYGTDRTARHSSQVTLTGPILELWRKARGWLEPHLGIVTDKEQSALSARQNRPKYSERAIQEALINALAHRDYLSTDPVRLAVYSDRIEISSPGGLPPETDLQKFEAGQAESSWRNPSLARLLVRLSLAQNIGRGIPTILDETRQLGQEARFETSADRVAVIIPATRPRSVPNEPIEPGAALILVSVGAESIYPQVTASLPELKNYPVALDFQASYLESSEDWISAAGRLRNELRAKVDQPQYRSFLLFYRGPVALAPLVGAMVNRATKALDVFTYEGGAYRRAYVLDSKFLRMVG